MIKRIDTQVIESINRLNLTSSEWLKIVEMFKADRDLLITKLINEEDDAKTKRYQGMLKYLDSILKYQTDAQTILQKRKEIT